MELVENKIRLLREQINKYNYYYYVLSQSLIDDKTFDLLLKELEDLEEKYPQFITLDSPTQRVGSDKSEAFTSVKHQYPMLSLSNTYNYEEVKDFYERVQEDLGNDFQINAELKYDGLSISLIYVDGVLERAVTRGDGVYGDDVTANVRTIRSIPLRLQGNGYPANFEIRGEILLPFKEFERINAERLEAGEPPFANPRNAASGTLKQLDPRIVSERRLDAYFYYVPACPELSNSHNERLHQCEAWGLKVAKAMELCSSLDEVYTFLDRWDKARFEEAVATDGVVLKVDSIKAQESMGYTAKSPRWAIAYKFSAEQKKTVLESVDYQVGRTGIITPVANLRPVQLSGTTVKRASLHNADFISGLDLYLGDTVLVEKGGEIIPKIVGVEERERDIFDEPIIFPSLCPACSTKLERIEGEAGYFCPNKETCIPQQMGKVEHFCSRKAGDIRIGPETIDDLFQHGLIKSIADLYKLSSEDIQALEGFKQKSADKLVASIEASKKRPYSAILFGLGIRHIGETTAKTLVKAFPSIDLLKEQTFESLCEVEDIGPTTAQSILDYFASEEHTKLIEELRTFGLYLEELVEETISEELLSQSPIMGKTCVISGTFTHYTRNEYKELLERFGAKLVSSISSKTDFILAGEKMGPSKLEKANKLGIKLYNENEFLSLMAHLIDN